MPQIDVSQDELDYIIARCGGPSEHSAIRPSDGLTAQGSHALVDRLVIVYTAHAIVPDDKLWAETVAACHGLKMKWGIEAAKRVVQAHGEDLKSIGATEDRDLWVRLRDAARRAYDRIEIAEEIMTKETTE